RLNSVGDGRAGRATSFIVVGRGGELGLLRSALREPLPVRVFALEPTTVLEVDSEHVMELTFKHPDLRRMWVQSYAKGMRKVYFGAAPKRTAMVLGLFHETPASR